MTDFALTVFVILVLGVIFAGVVEGRERGRT